jgi:hypothetical protein
VLVALLVIAPSARAARAQFWHVPQLDSIGQQLSGYPDMTVVGDDDPYEWGQLLGFLGAVNPAEQTLGFVTIHVLPGAATYHRIYISPSEWPALMQAANGDWSNAYNEAVAIFDLTHEATHYRLFSTDEGRVNACALQEFPAVLSTYFGVSSTLSQPTQIAHERTVYKTVKRTSYVRIHGKRVRHVRLVRVRAGSVVSYTDDGPPVVVVNPTYLALFTDAESFYASEPPPYSTGTCS